MGVKSVAGPGPARIHRINRILGLGLLPLLLVACSATPPDAGATSEPSVSSSPSFADPQPTPDPEESQGPLGGPAYERDEGTGAQGGQAGGQEVRRGAGEAPVVNRSNAVANPVRVEPAAFDAEARFADGVTATTSDFSRGTVQGEGQGIVAGAEYVVFTVSLYNGSREELDLSAVIPALMYGGEERTAAAPLYGEVPVADLTGVLKPGESTEGSYAFLIPAAAVRPVLYLDLNGTHQPLVFQGELP